MAENISLVLRFNNSGLGRFTSDPMAEHIKVLRSSKKVFFGKIGKPVSPPTLTQIEFQLQQRIPTYLFLLTKRPKDPHYSCYKCQLSSASVKAPQNLIVPEYYHHITGDFGTWFELATIEQCDHKILDNLFLASNRKVVSEALRSMSALFVVSNSEQSR